METFAIKPEDDDNNALLLELIEKREAEIEALKKILNYFQSQQSSSITKTLQSNTTRDKDICNSNFH